MKYKKNFKICLAEAARICGISYQSFWRYHQRLEAGEEPIRVVGRKPLPPIDYSEVKLEIRQLHHGRKRSSGTGKVREKCEGIVSKKKLEELIAEVKAEIMAGRQSHMTRIQWNCPHMVWSMDDFEYMHEGIKFYVHQVQDLTSKYKFDPLVSTQPITGEEVAGNLAKLFKVYGAPLFMKRDNGPNLNHFSVIYILQHFKVIPLNNPTYYPQYNGSMERAQRETKQELDNLVWEFKNPETFPFAARQAVHNLNHKPRPSLNGEWSCFQWQMHSDVKFSKTYRIQVYQEVKQLALDIASNVFYNDKELVLSKSWRKAVQTWLHRHEHISIKRNGKVLPISEQTA